MRDLLGRSDSEVMGKMVKEHVYLSVQPEEEHFWSPHLTLELIEGDQNLEIRGLFGPSPHVWLLYTFIYALLGFFAFIVLIIGGSRWNLGMSAGILWFFPVIASLVIMAYLTAKAGQKLGRTQMYLLYNFLMDSIGEQRIKE